MFGLHSSLHVMSECFLKDSNSMDSIPADMVLKKTLLDLQKRFPKNHVCPKCLAAQFCGSALPENGLAFRQDFEKVGKSQVDW